MPPNCDFFWGSNSLCLSYLFTVPHHKNERYKEENAIRLVTSYPLLLCLPIPQNPDPSIFSFETIPLIVRLGSSGLKVSKIILGCMSYGTPEWQPWVLPEEESLAHIKAASVVFRIISGNTCSPLSVPWRYDAGINTFDTANVRNYQKLLSSHKINLFMP